MTSFALSSITLVTNNELRSLKSNIEVNGIKYAVLGDRIDHIFTFQFDQANKTYTRVNTIKGHDGPISSVAFLKPCQWIKEGAVVTSSRDNLINVWPISILTEKGFKGCPLYVLAGHDNNVCYVDTTDDGKILSSSWDGTARVWISGSEVIKIKQEHGIWCFIKIPQGYATLGADKSIRLYDENGKQIYILENAHNDVVRSGFYNSNTGYLVTAANDGQINEWTIADNKLKKEYSITVTDTYLYSLTQVGKYYLATSEDKCVYVVDSEMKIVYDVLPIPGVPWCVSISPLGVSVVSTDGQMYSFSLNPEDRASAEIESSYVFKCESLTFSNPQFNEINILDLNYFDKNNTEIVYGRFELMRKEDNKVLVVYNRTYGWMIVGTLTDSKGSQSQKYTGPDGKEYDFCFNVELEDGNSCPLYLNYDTNPYMAASKFIQEHELPMYYLDTIANFIIRNLKGQKVQFTDKPQQSTKSEITLTYFPNNEPVFVVKENTVKILAKLEKTADPSTPLTDELKNKLSLPFSAEWTEGAVEVLLTWRTECSWPLLDLLRAYVLYDNASQFLSDDFLTTLIDLFSSDSQLDQYGIMGLMRLLCNLWKNFKSLASSQDMPTIFSTFCSRVQNLPLISQIPYINAIHNYVIFETNPNIKSLTTTVFSLLKQKLNPEVQKSLLIVLGNLMLKSKDVINEVLKDPSLISVTNFSSELKPIIEDIHKILSSN